MNVAYVTPGATIPHPQVTSDEVAIARVAYRGQFARVVQLTEDVDGCALWAGWANRACWSSRASNTATARGLIQHHYLAVTIQVYLAIYHQLTHSEVLLAVTNRDSERWRDALVGYPRPIISAGWTSRASRPNGASSASRASASTATTVDDELLNLLALLRHEPAYRLVMLT